MRDEATGDYARALEHYRASADRIPSGRLARNARSRIAWIEERSEGDFAPLAALTRLRRDPSVLDDPTVSARLAAETEAFPSGLVRSEMRLRIAQAWLRQPARRADALGELRKVVSDPSAGAADIVLAERDLVEAMLAAGQLDAARDEVRAHPFDPRAKAEVERLLHRRLLRRAFGMATALLALIALAVAAIVHLRLRTARRSPAAPALGPERSSTVVAADGPDQAARSRA